MDAILKGLAISPTVLLAQIVLFLALLFVMNAVFWKPVLGHLAQRDEHVAETYRTVERTQQEMETLRGEYLARLAQIEQEARTHIQQAIKEAQTERERLISEARTASDATLKSGIAAMEREKADALLALRPRLVGIAIDAASKALGSTTDQNALRQAIETNLMTAA